MELEQILREVPESLKALTENHQNLLNVAQYCTDNYLQTCGGAEALSHTRSLLTQSLASVAFQVNSVAESLLRLLDLQHHDLSRLQSSVLLLSQSVEMHREKVARREIGSFTSQRRVPRCHKLLPPAQPKARPPYTRQPICFQLLDTVGHGVKVGGKPSERSGTIRKPGSSFRTKAPELLQSSTVPPVSSFGKPVAPPSVPASWNAPPPCDVIESIPLSDVMDEAPPPPEVEPLAPPPPPPPPNQKPDEILDLIDSSEAGALPPPPPNPPGALIPPLAPPPPPGPPLAPPPPPGLPLAPPPPPLETVLEESSFPPPPDDFTEATPPSPEDTETPPPPPPPPITDDSASFVSRRSRHRAPPPIRSHSLRVRSGPASRCFTRSLFLPLSQSHLEIPPPPPPPLVQD
ncbi:abl interactor 2-like isoform X2 [Eucyclogobius newberryi]|uniref:abl interactor 2-like isoform X2 n=1 Tax=Eucyclogobius newberryi TaxID=166745 RepID=UPI003B5BB061